MNVKDIARIITGTVSSERGVDVVNSSSADDNNSHEIIFGTENGKRFQVTIVQIAWNILNNVLSKIYFEREHRPLVNDKNYEV